MLIGLGEYHVERCTYFVGFVGVRPAACRSQVLQIEKRRGQVGRVRQLAAIPDE